MARKRRGRWAAACVAVLAAGLLVAAFALAAVSLTADPELARLRVPGRRRRRDGLAGDDDHEQRAGPSRHQLGGAHGLDTDQFTVDSQPGDCDGSTVLDQDETCDVHVLFNPTAPGEKTADLKVLAPADDEVTVTLVGIGTQTELTLDTISMAFGDQDIDNGSTATRPPR